MLVKDSVVQERHGAMAPVEVSRDQITRWCDEQEQNAIHLEKNRYYLDPAAMAGTRYTPDELLAKFKSIDPDFRLHYNRFNPTKCWLFHKDKNVCCMENKAMGERSIIKPKERYIPDTTVTNISAHDMPKGRWAGFDQGFVYDDDVILPGYKKIVDAWGEEERGWRTVVLLAVKNGYITVADAERVFGNPGTDAWAGHTGKRVIKLNW